MTEIEQDLCTFGLMRGVPQFLSNSSGSIPPFIELCLSVDLGKYLLVGEHETPTQHSSIFRHSCVCFLQVGSYLYADLIRVKTCVGRF